MWESSEESTWGKSKWTVSDWQEWWFYKQRMIRLEIKDIWKTGAVRRSLKIATFVRVSCFGRILPVASPRREVGEDPSEAAHQSEGGYQKLVSDCGGWETGYETGVNATKASVFDEGFALGLELNTSKESHDAETQTEPRLRPMMPLMPRYYPYGGPYGVTPPMLYRVTLPTNPPNNPSPPP